LHKLEADALGKEIESLINDKIKERDKNGSGSKPSSKLSNTKKESVPPLKKK
jgi:hypothetical protein